MEQKFVFDGERVFLFSTDDFGEIDQLAVVAAAERPAIDGMSSGGIGPTGLFQGHADFQRPGIIFRVFYRAEFQRAFRAADDETTVIEAFDFSDRNPHCRCGFGVFQHGKAVVDQGIITGFLKK